MKYQHFYACFSIIWFYNSSYFVKDPPQSSQNYKKDVYQIRIQILVLLLIYPIGFADH